MSRDCGVGNGGCEHICVEKSGVGAGCECRTGFSLAQDNLSCEGKPPGDLSSCMKRVYKRDRTIQHSRVANCRPVEW